MRSIPKLVAKLSHYHEAWVVGSAADPNNKKPRDWDVLVPFSKWQDASGLIPENAKVNSFGGFKCVEDDVEIDVWCGELSWIIQIPKCKYIWNPKTGVRFTKNTRDV